MNFKQTVTSLFLLAAICAGDFSAFAQTRRGGTTGAPPKASSGDGKKPESSCKNGYQGTVTYTKTVSTSSTGRYGSYRNMKRVYTATIDIRDAGTLPGTVSMSAAGVTGSFNLSGRVTASENETVDQLDVSEKDEYCNLSLKGAGKPQRRRCENRLNDRSEASGTGDAANVFIGLRGRRMTLGITNLPKLAGSKSRASSTNCSGTCVPVQPTSASSSVEIPGAGERGARTDDDAVEFNPESFNRLAGSWTRTSTDGATVENFEWRLARCAPALEIADVRFEHKRVTDPDRWTGVDPLTGTVDGNLVRIKAKVYNNGGDTAYASVKFAETKSGEPLPDGATNVMVKPGEARDVEYEWDTSGFAWDENRRNQSEREIAVALEGGNIEKAKIKILPKPVVMVHGLWSNAAAWADYPGYLREAHSFAWKAYAVGADPEHGRMSTGDHPGNYKPTNTIYQNAQELAKQIKFARETNNAWHVDLVAHSMGGLISRQYINTFMPPVFDGRPEVTHLVMLGTPNMGSPCADTVNEQFEENGATEMHAMRELKPIIVRAFNQRVGDRKGVKFSVLIGVIPVPRTCLADGVFGDGVVPVESAKWNLTDYEYVPRNHIALTGEEDFKGFVLPRLAVGPKKARAEKSTALSFNGLNDAFALIDRRRSEAGSCFRNAAYKPADADSGDGDAAAKEKVVLAAKGVREIELPGAAAGVLIVAEPGVAATLTDAGGRILGQNEGGLEALRNPFRLILPAQKPSGALKLRLENFADGETVVFVTAFNARPAGSSLTIEAGKPTAAGSVPLIARWLENGAPVRSAAITGRIAGRSSEIRFYDDGRHGDGAADDGLYGAAAEKLPVGDYFIEIEAEAGSLKKTAVAPLGVGAPNAPAKPVRRGR
ncbi:MAG: hypothetical protein JSS81_22605 [Acidobacteria bacterium]|nr:hypothetical protein [Acidobacteriota bacterium]